MNVQSVKNKGARAIVYCRSEARDGLQRQEEKILKYVKSQDLSVRETFMESGNKTDSLTYHSLRLRAKYREFDVLLITELSVLGNGAIEITHEVSFLNENGVKVVSVKDGELNAETLPQTFRKNFCLVKKSFARAY